jgi:hypothetical protein
MFAYQNLIVNRTINSALLIKVNSKSKSAIRINTDFTVISSAKLRHLALLFMHLEA